MAETKFVSRKVVWSIPDEIKPLRGVIPMHCDITLRFRLDEIGRVRINKGPWLILEDMKDHWAPLAQVHPRLKLYYRIKYKVKRWMKHISDDFKQGVL